MFPGALCPACEGGWRGRGSSVGGVEEKRVRGRMGEVLCNIDDVEKMDVDVDCFGEAEHRGCVGREGRKRVRGELGEWEIIERGEVEGFEEFVKVWGDDVMEAGGGDFRMRGLTPNPMEVLDHEEVVGGGGLDIQSERGSKRRECGEKRVRWFNGVDGEVSAVREYGHFDQPRLIGLTEDV